MKMEQGKGAVGTHTKWLASLPLASLIGLIRW